MPSARILVTDDDPNLREVVSYTLARHGYQIVEASHGVEALSLLRGGDFDLVVLDVLMPELDGLETCRRLRCVPFEMAVQENLEERGGTIHVTSEPGHTVFSCRLPRHPSPHHRASG